MSGTMQLTLAEKCFVFYPQFKDDFDFLVKHKIINEAGNNFTWNKSETSLGQYFHDFMPGKIPVEGGRWAPIENLFNIERGALRHLVSPNGRGVSGNKKSRDYELIIKLLEPYRIEIQARKKFLRIQEIIKNTTDKNLLQSLEEIKNVLITI